MRDALKIFVYSVLKFKKAGINRVRRKTIIKNKNFHKGDGQ